MRYKNISHFLILKPRDLKDLDIYIYLYRQNPLQKYLQEALLSMSQNGISKYLSDFSSEK